MSARTSDQVKMMASYRNANGLEEHYSLGEVVNVGTPKKRVEDEGDHPIGSWKQAIRIEWRMAVVMKLWPRVEVRYLDSNERSEIKAGMYIVRTNAPAETGKK